MTPRHQARLDAAAALLAAGWPAERIALALAISRATVERLMPKRVLATPLLEAAAAPRPLLSGCCQRDRLGYYCDAPTLLGEVFCVQHTHGGVWAS